VADGGAQGINTIAHLNAVHNDNGELSTSDTVNVHWVSHPRYGSFSQSPPSSSDAGYGQGPSRGADRGGSHAADSFYFAGRNNEQTGHYSVRLQGRGVDATSTALTTNGTWVLTAEGDSFLMLSPNSGVTITLNPERDGSANYKFPEGHIIEVCNDGAGDIVFDNQTSPAGLNATLSSGHRATFIYEGTVWVRCDYQSAIIANAPAIEISGGAPVFATGITQAEMLTLLGVEAGATADQTDAEIRAAVEAATDSNVFTDADHTKLNGIAAGAEVNVNADWNAVSGDAEILNKPTDVTDLSTHSVTELNDVSNAGSGAIITSAERTTLGTALQAETDPVFSASAAASITNAGSGSVITSAERTKLTGIETSADVTDATNVKSALDGMTLTDVGTPASTDRILLQDASDSNNLKYADFSEFGGGGGSYTDAEAIAAVEGEATLDLTGDVRIGGTESHRLYVEETTDSYPVRIRSSDGNIRTNKYGHIQLQNDNTSPPSSSTIDDPVWQIGQRDNGIFDIAFGDISVDLVPLSKAILQLTRATPTDEASDPQIGFFGTSPAGKTAVPALGAQTSAGTGAPAAPGAGDTAHADFSAAVTQLNTNITNLQGRLDDLITSLSNLGLV